VASSEARLSANPALLCAYHACCSALFPAAIFSLFWHDTLHMSLSTMLSVQALFGFVLAAFEFPSGYIADRLGHRLAVLAGTGLVVLGWLLYGVATGLWGTVLAEAVLGVGMSLISGADTALLYESLQRLGREHEYARWYARMRVVAQVAEGGSALVAGLLFAYSPWLPFQLQALVMLLAGLLVLRMVSTPVSIPQARGHLAQMGYIVRHALREHPTLPALLFTSVSFSLMSFLPVWLVSLHARESGISSSALGLFWAAANFIVAIGALQGERLGRVFGLPRFLVGCALLSAVGYAVLAFAPGVVAPFGYFALTLVRGLHAPELHHAEQRAVPSGDRAAFLSFRNFLFRGSYVILGPLIGFVADRTGLRWTLCGIGALVVPFMLLAIRSLRRALASASA
jgi:MFS family permease